MSLYLSRVQRGRMPGRAFKPCVHPGCTELVQSGSLCVRHRRVREQERGTSSARGYGYSWRQIRDAFLQKHPWCSDPFGFHKGENVRARHVDHRVPLRLGGSNDESNLNGMCDHCHDHKTATMDGGFGNAVQPVQGRGGQNV